MKLPFFNINWSKDDISAVKKVIESGSYWCLGKEIDDFEKKIAQYLGVKYCKVFNSGGSALHAIMFALGISKNDEVIIPSFTFIATAYAPLYVGAKPVFADIETDTYGLDIDDVERKITPKTKAIIPIHYGGVTCRINDLKRLAKKHNLYLVEDAAESFGSKENNKLAGTFGDAAIFSFCQNKIFTTGEGGCVVTNDKKVFEKLELLSSYGRKVEGDYFSNPSELDYVSLGFNFRMPSMLAALGLSQLSRVDDLIKKRRKAASYLNKNLESIKKIRIPKYQDSKFAVYQMYTIEVLGGEKDRDFLKNELEKVDVPTKIYFDPVHNYSIFNKESNINLPNTELISSRVLSLPIYPDIKKEQLDFIINSIKRILNQ